MSKFPGGIFSKARGKTSGIVFSAARTRQGKMMTSRALVIPNNPQTQDQQENRMIFKFVQTQTRDIGPGIYRIDWNRGVEDLPGYQSLLSLMRRTFRFNTNESAWLSDLPLTPVLLGDLHTPETMGYAGSPTNMTWSTENGENGQATDQVVVLSFSGFFATSELVQEQVFAQVNTANRSVGTLQLPSQGGSRDLFFLDFVYVRRLTNPVETRYSNALKFHKNNL